MSEIRHNRRITGFKWFLRLVVVCICFPTLSCWILIPSGIHIHHENNLLSGRNGYFLTAKKNNSISADNSSNTRHRKRNKPRSSSRAKGPVKRWRIFGVEVHPDRLVNAINQKGMKEHDSVSDKFLERAVLDALTQRLKTTNYQNVNVVRRSLDARSNIRRADGGKGPRFVYVLDFDSNTIWKSQPGRLELYEETQIDKQQTGIIDNKQSTDDDVTSKKHRVIIVGAGPAGLFCALQLAKSGVVIPIVLERGQPVESRGKDIGALMHRRAMDTESNFAFGEGGAGTWSDGKLTTRIGRNSISVRTVLNTFVHYGAPEEILIEGAPHLGTDNLVRMLRNMRKDLRKLGGEIHFGHKVTSLIIEDGRTKGVEYIVSRKTIERNMDQETVAQQLVDEENSSGTLLAEAVVLATGHSARDVYEKLHADGVKLEPKGFAVGFRIEHPQKFINKIQYGCEWGPSVITGKKTTDSINEEYFASQIRSEQYEHHDGRLPVPSYRLATDKAFDGEEMRGVYSFCMCPGGQIVPASTDPNEICVNGMSFSRRDSIWANSALVVTVSPDDIILEPYRKEFGILAGVAFQRDMERRASKMGGGNLTVPVQRVTDFLEGKQSTSAPSSSYRLGVKPAACHEIYPQPLVQSLRHALTQYFDKQMPGYVSDCALLHGVETRTSSPVRVSRDRETLQAIGTSGLYPAGEGAGFAGGIVSAAVDGLVVAETLLDNLVGPDRAKESGEKIHGGVDSFY